MKLATAKFLRVRNRLPHFAVVSVAVDLEASGLTIELACNGAGFTSQGYSEEVPAVGYDDWKAGAKAGVSFAVVIAEKKKCHVQITKIEGLGTDTNPTIVGIAAAFATWQALDFSASKEVVEKIENQAFSSWSQLPHTIPKFA